MDKKLYTKYTISFKERNVRFHFYSEEDDSRFVWNCSMLAKITKYGLRNKSVLSVIEGLRNSYGIDFTKVGSLDNKTLEEAKSELVTKIENSKKSFNERSVDLYTRKLVKFNKRNKTYNNFRVRLYNYTNKDGFFLILASFLILTGQVFFSNKKGRLLFNIPSKTTQLRPVKDFHSYDKKESFNQLIFDRIYIVSANSLRQRKLNGLTFCEACRDIPDFLSRKKITYNRMYSSVILSNVYKLAKALTYEDASEILGAVFLFRSYCDEQHINHLRFKSDKIVSKLLDMLKNKAKTKTFNRFELKYLRSSLSNKRGIDCFVSSLSKEIDKRYIDRSKYLELLSTLSNVVKRSL